MQVDDNIREQHVVSRTVLKQWANQDRMLHAISVINRTAKVIVRGPGGLGKIPNFVPQGSRSVEQLWGKAEKHVPRLARSCDAGTLLDDADAAAAMRDLVALHYVRSRTFARVHLHAYQSERAAMKRQAREVPGYEDGFRRRFHRPLSDQADHDFYFEMVLARKTDSVFHSGLLFRASVERMFDRVRSWMDSRPLQLVHPASGEFLIGDVPVVVIDAQGRHSPDEVTALGDASQILMPITPRSLVAFGPVGRGDVPVSVVDELNTCQVRSAHEHVFVRPGSELEQFVRDCRFGPVGTAA